MVNIHVKHKFMNYWRDNLYFEAVENVLKKYFNPRVSYYLEFANLMTAEGDSCDDLKKFWKTIEGKNEVIKFFLEEIEIFSFFQENSFRNSTKKIEFLIEQLSL